MNCLLCQEKSVQLYHLRKKDQAQFFVCTNCGFVFLDPKIRLTREQEKTRYELHENHDTLEYRKFLFRLVDFLLPHLSTEMRGLDYGCGPVKIMEKIFQEKSISVESYDPYYFPTLSLEKKSYDFITCSEVAEHFFSPLEEFEYLFSLLKPGGYLAIMTAFLPKDKAQFQNWHYQRDPTHVSFYSPSSLQWIAQKFQVELILKEPFVALFRKL